MAVDNQKLMYSGAIAGAATPYLLKFAVMPVLDLLGKFAPTVSLKLANPEIAVNVRESLTGIQAGLAGWTTNALGLTVPDSAITMILMSAVGGALFFVLGGMLANAIGFLEGNAVQKTRAVVFSGSIVAALILGTIALPPALNLTLVNLLIALGVNAAILSYLYVKIDEKGKFGLVPF